MNHFSPTRSAMVALLITAVASSHGSAAVVVLANRTSDTVDFVVGDEVQEHPHTLAPQEVQTLRVSTATDFWFADDPEGGYRLRDGCAYVLLRNRGDRRLELHRVGLADEQGSLDEQTGTAREPSSPAASSADERGSDSEGGAVVQVIIAFDAAGPVDENCEERLRATLESASQITSPQCGVRFEAVGFQLWRSTPAAADFDEAWRGLVSAVAAEPGKLVIGFTTRPFLDATCSGFPATAGPLGSHMLMVEGLTSQREPPEKLLHALGHYLGAAHSPESDSIMRPTLDRGATDAREVICFDPINALAMALVGEELATRAPESLAALSPRVRRRLISVYATLAEAVPQDPLAKQFSRLLSVAPSSRAPSMTTTRAPHADGSSTSRLDKGLARPAGDPVAPGRETLTTTTELPLRDLAETPHRAEADPAPGNQSSAQEQSADFGGEGDDSLSDPLALPKALTAALVLVAVPIVMLGWRLICGIGATSHISGQETAPPNWRAMRSIDRAAWWLYLSGVAGVTTLSATSLSPGQTGGWKAAGLLLMAGMTAMTVAPLYPIVGPLAYLVLSYAVQGDDPAAVRIDHSGVLAYLPLLALAASGLRLLRQRRLPRPPQGSTVWVLLAMMVWIGLAAAGAAMTGLPVSSNLVHRTARFAQVLVLFLVMLYADPGLAELRLTSIVLALALFARVHVFRADVSLEQNLAMVAAIVCPLLFVVAQTAPSRLAKVGFYLMLGYFVVLIMRIQNRAAMLALPAAAAVLLLSSRHRGRALLIAAPVAVVLAIWLPGSGLVNRFAEIYQEGQFQGSAYYRLRIWTAGWQMARDHAALGVGPGNFELLIGDYDSELPSIPPHNSFVQMAAETGLPGAAAYVVFIVTASLQLVSIVRRYCDDWRGCVAGGVLASLAAHLVTGCFLENPSLAATYVVLGIGIALGAAPATHVYRERLYLPLADALAKPLAELVVRLPRVASGMPVAQWSASSSREPCEEVADGPTTTDLRPQDSTWWLRLLLGFDILVTVLGSLAPFSFGPMGVHAACDLYWRQLSRGIEFSDRSDWLANMLLFVPLGFLSLATYRPRRRGARVVVASLLVVAACLLSSAAIELAQVWFPSRTVNLNDVVAETMGAAAGVVVFLLFGDRLLNFAAGAFAGRNPLSANERMLVCYAAGVFVYAAWPFDFTINPTDFAAKLREGRIDFTDWVQPGWFARFAISAALMAPIGLLLTTVGTRLGRAARSLPELMAWGLAWLLAIEFCRLLTYSQSVGTVHLAGGAAGILLGSVARKSFAGPR